MEREIVPTAFAVLMRILEPDEVIHKGVTPAASIALNHLWESSSQGPSTILPRHMPSPPGSTTMIEATRSPSDPIMGIPFFEGHALFPQVIQRASKVKPEKAFSIPVIEIDKYF